MPIPTHKREDTTDYRRIFMDETPLFDVRAPVEFEKGSVPGAVNLPLMVDEEREAVGIAYKNDGQNAAIDLGHQLVEGDVKAARVAAWAKFATDNPKGYLFCMRGGLRSQISQQWMDEAGSPYPLVGGGYKALRRFLIEEAERLVAAHDFIVVAGRTGAGKTDFLEMVPNSVDLEGLANHRGSSFGRRLGDQPRQINFDNALSVRLMKLDEKFDGPIFIEDEGRRIGNIEIPLMLATKMDEAPAILIEEPFEARVDIIHRDYVAGLAVEYQGVFGEEAHQQHGDFLLTALYRIRKRLGGSRYQDVEALMTQALETQAKTGSDDMHRAWIELLLKDYYDPMYEYQLASRERTILFTGRRLDAVEWSKEMS